MTRRPPRHAGDALAARIRRQAADPLAALLLCAVVGLTGLLLLPGSWLVPALAGVVAAGLALSGST